MLLSCCDLLLFLFVVPFYAAALQDNDPGSIILVELVKPPGVSLGLTLNGKSESGVA